MDIAKLADLSCDDALAAIWDYLDEELDDRAAIRIAVHLWLCAGCCRAFELERRFLLAIASTAPPTDLSRLRPRILRALARGASLPS